MIDNVMIGFYRRETTSTLASLMGLPAARGETRKLRARALALLERFGMAHLAEHEAGGLAYGHQRRVEMMRALASDPALILLDEPVAGMNDVEAGELGEIFSGLARDGMGVLLIEHNVRFRDAAVPPCLCARQRAHDRRRHSRPKWSTTRR